MKAINNGELLLENQQAIEPKFNSLFPSYTSSVMDFMRTCWPKVSERNGCIIFSDVNTLYLSEMLQIIGNNRASVETQLNRRRLVDFLPANGPVSTSDLVELGSMVQAMWRTKLSDQYPGKSFTVIFTQGKTGLDTENFELTFFQNSISPH